MTDWNTLFPVARRTVLRTAGAVGASLFLQGFGLGAQTPIPTSDGEDP